MTSPKDVLLAPAVFALALLAAPLAVGQEQPSASPVGAAASAPVSGAVAADLPSDEFLESAGAVIGEISVEGLDIFDTRLEEEDNAVFRAANWLHVKTRDKTILQQLLVKPGDPYRARLLRESERLLRANGYLRDAEIRVVAYRNGVADLRVFTQDVWTFKPDISISRKGGTNSTSFGIQETNLLGRGKTLGLDFSSDVDRDTKSLIYRDRHVAGSWWSLDTQYAENSDGDVKKLEVKRPFYALDTRWAAGVSLSEDTRIDSVYQLGEIVSQYSTAERHATVFGGWSRGLVDGFATRLTVGYSYDDIQHGPAGNPPGTVPPGLLLAYPWLGVAWVEDQFQTARNLDQIGKTEDVALGWNVEGRLGLASTAWGSDRNAGVFAAMFSKGWQLTPAQRLLMSGRGEGRIERDGLAGALFHLAGRYYLQQSGRRTFFASAAFDRGVNLDADQRLYLGGDSGLRGYPLRYQSGSERWLVTVEQRAFTEWYPFRLFNVGGAVFFDMGRTWGGESPQDSSQGLLRDVGFGLRLGNSRSALGTVLHFDLAFPLDGDPSIDKVQFLVEAKASF